VSAAGPGHGDGMRRGRGPDVRGGHLNTGGVNVAGTRRRPEPGPFGPASETTGSGDLNQGASREYFTNTPGVSSENPRFAF
jgi:hypothetical protein